MKSYFLMRVVLALICCLIPMLISTKSAPSSSLFQSPGVVTSHLLGALPLAMALCGILWIPQNIVVRMIFLSASITAATFVPYVLLWEWGPIAVFVRLMVCLAVLTPAIAAWRARWIGTTQWAWLLCIAWALLTGVMEVKFEGARVERQLIDCLKRESISDALRNADILSGLGITSIILPGKTDRVDVLSIREKLKRQKLALEQITQSVQAKPMDTVAKISVAVAFARLGRLSEAIAQLQDCPPQDERVELLRGAFFQGLKDFQTSSYYYLLAHDIALAKRDGLHQLEAETNMARALRGLAFNARRDGSFDKSEVWYRLWIKEIPAGQTEALFQLGLHYIESGQPYAASVILFNLAHDVTSPMAYAAQEKLTVLLAEHPLLFFGTVKP